MTSTSRRSSRLAELRSELSSLRAVYASEFSSLGDSLCGLLPATVCVSSPGERFLSDVSGASKPLTHEEWLSACRQVEPPQAYLRRGEGNGGGASSLR